jgi:rhodanese-related sulfurtransferase
MNKEINATEAVILHNKNKEAVFLDVREHSELAICRIEGALHIPMGEVPERHEALPRDAPLIVLCHHGMRSLNVVQYLETKGFGECGQSRGWDPRLGSGRGSRDETILVFRSPL